MEILWIAHAVPYPPKAGFLLRSYNLLRELARNHTVDLVAFVQEPWMRTLFPSLEEGMEESRRVLGGFCRSTQFLPIDKLQRPLGKHLAALGALLRGEAYTTAWLTSKAAQRSIATQIAQRPYDIVHFDTIGLAGYRPLVRDSATTLTHHNVESHMMFRRADNADNKLAAAYFKHEAKLIARLERHSARLFDAHITCSDLDTQRLHDVLGDINATAIPNGVDCEYFRAHPDTSTRPDSLIFVGTMNWYPNVDAMIFFLKQVWPLLKQKRPRLVLDIVGSNPPAALKEMSQALSGVTVHGYVDDVRPMIDSAALFICPIRDGGGTKLKILDAFAMSKCVVAHPIACEGIDATPDQDVAFASTPEEFVTQIDRLLDDASSRAALGRAARSLVENKYSFRSIGDDFSALLENVSRSRGSKHFERTA